MSDQNSKNYIISEIKLPNDIKESYEVYDHENPDGQDLILTNLSKVNLLIGANNSGKSRTIRSVFQQPVFKYFTHLLDINPIQVEIDKIKDQITDDLGESGRNRMSDINLSLKDFKNRIHVYIDSKIDENFIEIKMRLLNPFNMECGVHITENVRKKIFNYDNYQQNKNTKLLMEIKRIYTNFSKSFFRIYIPTLRGLRPFDKGESTGDYQKVKCRDCYDDRSVSDYFPKYNPEENRQQIFTGLSMFEQVFKHLLSYESDRRVIKDFEDFLSENFFEKKEVAIIPNIKEKNNDVLYVKIGDEDEYPIYQLGDGIQQLIIMTFPVFLHQNENVLLFIEEPELYLHPGMQRQLMDILLNHEKFRNVQTYITTHSNHLLDLTLDYDSISVYRFEKDEARMKNELDRWEYDRKKPENMSKKPKKPKPRFKVQHTDHDDIRLLQSLGVQSSSVFLANCTIWVEGISDRIYLRKYLELYLKDLRNYQEVPDLKEDIHYAFVEYSGNNITHWSFLDSEENPINFERITNHVFLVADKDKNKERRHEKLKAKLGEKNTGILDVREVENLLKKDVLLEVVKQFIRRSISGNDEDKLHVIENININFRDSTIKNKPIGDFIDKTILRNEKCKQFRTFGKESGTLRKDKAKFARYATEQMKSINDMSDEAIELSKKIYGFILRSNG